VPSICSGARAMLPSTSTIAAASDDGAVRPHQLNAASAVLRHPLLNGGTVHHSQPPFGSSPFATSNFPFNVLPPQSNTSASIQMPPSALLPYPPIPVGEKALPQPSRTESSPSWRSGKWLPAEEHYALLLVALFERGMIADGVDGTTTLRTYLSQKLHCAPMRISKKFAGRGIGKLVYSSSSKPSLEPHKAQELLERLRIAEQLFLQAAYPPPVAASLGATSVRSSFVVFAVVLFYRLIVLFRKCLQFPLLSIPPTVAQPLPVFPTAIPGMVATGLLTASTGEAMQAHTKQLHESYLRALQQADEESTHNKSSSMPPPMNVASIVPTVAQPPSEIPNLLSGFDKFVQKNQSTTPEQTSVPPPIADDYSPPFTSRSFDEFHRFLGKEELPLLDAPSSPHESSLPIHTTTMVSFEPTATLDVTVPDTAALFTAESYAMLAQASAMEASRHGAYSMSPLLHHPSSGLDVDQVLQQVGVHHPRPRHPSPVAPQTTLRTMVDVHRSHHPSSLHTPSSTTGAMTTDAARHHITAAAQAEGNIVSGSEPSGSSSSRSNTDNTSSGSDTTGMASNEDDCSEEGVASCYTSSGDDSFGEDDDEDAPLPPRKKSKGVEQREEKPKRVQFQ
jgi:hypothetical protein